jgi:hypothetical protein
MPPAAASPIAPAWASTPKDYDTLDPQLARHGRPGHRVNHSEIVSFLWGVADHIRDTVKRGNIRTSFFP